MSEGTFRTMQGKRFFLKKITIIVNYTFREVVLLDTEGRPYRLALALETIELVGCFIVG